MRNKFEKKLLEQCKKIGIKHTYESKRIPYIRYHVYIPDIILHTPLGEVLIEAKGYFRPEHRAKMLAVKKQHPNLDIRLIFYRSSKKDIKWAIKNNFIYAIGEIPNIWFEGKW